MQIPEVRVCDVCGEERLTIVDDDGNNVCNPDLPEGETMGDYDE